MLSKILSFAVAANAVQLSRLHGSGRSATNIQDDSEDIVLAGAKKCNAATPGECMTTHVNGRFCHYDAEKSDCFFSCDEFEDKYHEALGTNLAMCKDRAECRVTNAARDDCDPNDKFFQNHDVEDSDENIKTGSAACNAAEPGKCEETSSGVQTHSGTGPRMCHYEQETKNCFFSCDEFEGDLEYQCSKHKHCTLKGHDCDPNKKFFESKSNDEEDSEANIIAGGKKCAEKNGKGETDCVATKALAGDSVRYCHFDKNSEKCFYSCDQYSHEMAKDDKLGNAGSGVCQSMEQCQINGNDDCDPNDKFHQANKRSSLNQGN